MNDCFAKARRGCKVLSTQNCIECNFYKTQRDYELGQEQVIKRLKSLDKTTRFYISKKYRIGGLV